MSPGEPAHELRPSGTSGGGDDLRGRSLRGALWVATQKWYSRLAGLLAMVVLARILGPGHFGLVALAGGFIGISAVVTELGLVPALVQARIIGPKTLSTAFWLCVTLSL